MSQNNIDLSSFLRLQSQYTNDLSNIPIDPKQTANANAIQDLSKHLSGMYNTLSDSTAASQNTIEQQNKVNDILQNEYTRLQQKQQNIDAATYGQKRVIELNTSYQKRYTAYTNIMIAVVATLLIYIAIYYLDTYVPVVPKVVLYVLTIFLFSGAIMYIFLVYIDIIRRDNIDFDQLQLAPPLLDASGNSIGGTLNMQNNTFNPLGYYGCIGQSCCAPGTTWDNVNGGCMNNTPCGASQANTMPAAKQNAVSASQNIAPATQKQGFDNMNDVKYSNEFLIGESESKMNSATQSNMLMNNKQSPNYCTNDFECYSMYNK